MRHAGFQALDQLDDGLRSHAKHEIELPLNVSVE